MLMAKMPIGRLAKSSCFPVVQNLLPAHSLPLGGRSDCQFVTPPTVAKKIGGVTRGRGELASLVEEQRCTAKRLTNGRLP
jgi:hypothetical protein